MVVSRRCGFDAWHHCRGINGGAYVIIKCFGGGVIVPANVLCMSSKVMYVCCMQPHSGSGLAAVTLHPLHRPLHGTSSKGGDDAYMLIAGEPRISVQAGEPDPAAD